MRLRRSGIITKLVVLALVLYGITSIISLRAKIEDAKAEQMAIKQQVTDREVENAELEYKLEHAEDDEVIADIAREDFGLVMPGEVVFYSTDAPLP